MGGGNQGEGPKFTKNPREISQDRERVGEPAGKTYLLQRTKTRPEEKTSEKKKKKSRSRVKKNRNFTRIGNKKRRGPIYKDIESM